jgi:hypothetical protein
MMRGRSWAVIRAIGNRPSIAAGWFDSSPVLDGKGSRDLGVVEAEGEDELRNFAAGDPVVTTGAANPETGRMFAGFPTR